MQQNNTVETIIGALVVAVAVAFIFFAWRTTGGAIGGYEISAKLARVDGLSVGTDVRLSGIKIGEISSMTLNPNYLVTVHMTIHKDIEIPDDSSLAVTSSGVLGSSYISISPGGDDTMLKDGGQIKMAQGSVDLMGLVGRFIGGENGQQGGQKPVANKPPQTPATNRPAPTQGLPKE